MKCTGCYAYPLCKRINKEKEACENYKKRKLGVKIEIVKDKGGKRNV